MKTKKAEKRITPAYAGKRNRNEADRAQRQDHPRLRGEKKGAGSVEYGMKGSPPLTRGKVCFQFFRCRDIGITPAYAGKRKSFRTTAPTPRDHPRLRGEKFIFLLSFTFFAGSPPLTRGKGAGCQQGIKERRITPAYAGKSHCILCIHSTA